MLIIFFLLVIVTAVEPERTHISHYELSRRAEAGNVSAQETLLKQRYRPDLESMLRVKSAFLLVVVSFLIIACFGWVLGTILALIVILEYGAIARTKFVRRIARRLYSRIEHTLLSVAIKLPGLMKLIRSSRPDTAMQLTSRQELEHIINESETVLSPDEKKLVMHSLAFSDKTVSSIMTPVDQIISIKKTEFLGPLTLNELHQTGHSRLPVIGADIDHIVGILYLQNLLALDIKRSVTAEKAMDAHVSYIHQDQTLPDALAALLRTHQHLFIVINESRRTVGLVTIDDVLEALIGRRLVDNFNDHESIRAVSERHPEAK